MMCADRARNALAAGVFAIAVGQANPYQVVPNHFKLPAGRTMGSTAAIDIDRDGRSVRVFERCGVASNGPDTFGPPSDVLVAPNGDIFVADGHGGNTNARLVKFSPDGKFIKEWGRKGAGPGEFDAPHSLAMDSRGRLFVADRGNS